MYLDPTAESADWKKVYQLCIGIINPRPIALVSTISRAGAHNLAPYSFYNMISANPPMIVLGPSLRRDRSRKDTLVNIEEVGEFVIASVTANLAEKMVKCSTELPRGESEFDLANLTPAPATKVKPPLVREAKVNIECTLSQIIPTGDEPGGVHIVLADIVAIHLDDAVLDDQGRIDPRKLQTVGRLGDNWYSNVDAPYEMPLPGSSGAERA